MWRDLKHLLVTVPRVTGTQGRLFLQTGQEAAEEIYSTEPQEEHEDSPTKSSVRDSPCQLALKSATAHKQAKHEKTLCACTQRVEPRLPGRPNPDCCQDVLFGSSPSGGWVAWDAMHPYTYSNKEECAPALAETEHLDPRTCSKARNAPSIQSKPGLLVQ